MISSTKVIIPQVDFNITNQCNLNCNGCYSLSNYDLTGHQLWNDYKDSCQELSTKVHINEWTLYGGEPTLNPTYLDWLKGLSELWPNSNGYLLTNGFTLNDRSTKSKKLYEFLAEHADKVSVRISLHDVRKLNDMIANVKSWLKDIVDTSRYPDIEKVFNSKQNWAESYARIKDASWPDCKSWDDFKNLPQWIQDECDSQFNFSDVKFKDNLQGYKFIDVNGVTVQLDKIHWHVSGPLLPQADLKTFKLHSSDPVKAHDVCNIKNCTEFYQGKLHKCNAASHFGEFNRQYYIELTEEEERILNAYTPCDASSSIEEIRDFLEMIKHPIPQCRFCNDSPIPIETQATVKPIKFQKRI
jgi:organic radical activating enzyme